MGTYPECDRYECPECPRQQDCVEAQTPTDEADAWLDYVDDRINELEEQIEHLKRFEGRVLAVFSAIVKSLDHEED